MELATMGGEYQFLINAACISHHKSTIPMTKILRLLAILLAPWGMADWAWAGGKYYEVEYAGSERPGELVMGVTYTVWVPDGVRSLRGLIVHQHGCGVGACQGGATAAYDLHWQALAARRDCALLGPSYHQAEAQNCRLWCDPRNGSSDTFLRALKQLGEQCKHPELASVPWCLWGHSGGGFWASLMQTMYPERIVAIWLRSGSAYSAWEKGEIPKPQISDAVYQIPVMCNPGSKEQGHERFNGAFTGTLAMFQAYRKQGAPIGFAPDPRTAHECGDSRYLAIPFFDACLAMRLPQVKAGSPANEPGQLRPMDKDQAWLATVLGNQAVEAAKYAGEASEAVYLPNASVAKAWEEYVATGAVSDSTPPDAPTDVVALPGPNGMVVRWNAKADFESGLQAFLIQRNGETIARLPEQGKSRFGRPLFQSMSYHDTPEKPLPNREYTDPAVPPGKQAEYRVVAVNSVGLKSQPSEAGVAKNE